MADDTIKVLDDLKKANCERNSYNCSKCYCLQLKQYLDDEYYLCSIDVIVNGIKHEIKR